MLLEILYDRNSFGGSTVGNLANVFFKCFLCDEGFIGECLPRWIVNGTIPLPTPVPYPSWDYHTIHVQEPTSDIRHYLSLLESLISSQDTMIWIWISKAPFHFPSHIPLQKRLSRISVVGQFIGRLERGLAVLFQVKTKLLSPWNIIRESDTTIDNSLGEANAPFPIESKATSFRQDLCSDNRSWDIVLKVLHQYSYSTMVFQNLFLREELPPPPFPLFF